MKHRRNTCESEAFPVVGQASILINVATKRLIAHLLEDSTMNLRKTLIAGGAAAFAGLLAGAARQVIGAGQ